MATPDRDDKSKIEQPEQQILNYSFDEIFKILMVGLAGYNATQDRYDRVQVDDTSGGIKTTPSGIYAYDSGGTLRSIAAVQSSDNPSLYGLLVLNHDGSQISGGGGSTPATDNLLLESGDNLLLETGDQLLLE